MECYIIDYYSIKKNVRKKLLNKKTIIRIAGMTIILLAAPNFAHAATGIDVGANKIYKKLLNVGQWVIICKGAIDTIQSMVQQDMQGVRKNFFGYVTVYIILRALPWSLKQVDILFDDL